MDIEKDVTKFNVLKEGFKFNGHMHYVDIWRHLPDTHGLEIVFWNMLLSPGFYNHQDNFLHGRKKGIRMFVK